MIQTFIATIKCLLQSKSFLKDSLIISLPEAQNNNQIFSLYKYYYFAENLQYYHFLHLHHLFISGDTKYTLLDGCSFATLPLVYSYDEYFAKCLKSAERALIRKAIKNGFTVRQIKYDEHLVDIQEINNSKPNEAGAI